MLVLSWSAEESGVRIDLAGIVDPDVDTGIQGGRELIALARTAVSPLPDAGVVDTLADVVGAEAAVSAVGVAGAFQMTNRIVEATGLPVLPRQLEQARPMLEVLGADRLPHSGLANAQRPTGLLWKIRKRLRR